MRKNTAYDIKCYRGVYVPLSLKGPYEPTGLAFSFEKKIPETLI